MLAWRRHSRKPFTLAVVDRVLRHRAVPDRLLSWVSPSLSYPRSLPLRKSPPSLVLVVVVRPRPLQPLPLLGVSVNSTCLQRECQRSPQALTIQMLNSLVLFVALPSACRGLLPTIRLCATWYEGKQIRVVYMNAYAAKFRSRFRLILIHGHMVMILFDRYPDVPLPLPRQSGYRSRSGTLRSPITQLNTLLPLPKIYFHPPYSPEHPALLELDMAICNWQSQGIEGTIVRVGLKLVCVWKILPNGSTTRPKAQVNDLPCFSISIPLTLVLIGMQ